MIIIIIIIMTQLKHDCHSVCFTKQKSMNKLSGEGTLSYLQYKQDMITNTSFGDLGITGRSAVLFCVQYEFIENNHRENKDEQKKKKTNIHVTAGGAFHTDRVM